MEGLDCFFDDEFVKTHYGFLFDDDFCKNTPKTTPINMEYYKDGYILIQSVTYKNSKIESELITSWSSSSRGSFSSAKEQPSNSFRAFLSNFTNQESKNQGMFDGVYQLDNNMDFYVEEDLMDLDVLEGYLPFEENGTVQEMEGDEDVLEEVPTECYKVNLKRTRPPTPKKKRFRKFYGDANKNKLFEKPFPNVDGIYCRFCYKNGEKTDFYKSHVVKKSDGTVICPVLRKYVCEMCSATGDHAHTRRYCPFYVEK